jgi:hypothetical protein
LSARACMCGTCVLFFGAPFFALSCNVVALFRASATKTPGRTDARPSGTRRRICRASLRHPPAIGVAYDVWPRLSVVLCASAQLASGPPVCARRMPRWLGFLIPAPHLQIFRLILGLDGITSVVTRLAPPAPPTCDPSIGHALAARTQGQRVWGRALSTRGKHTRTHTARCGMPMGCTCQGSTGSMAGLRLLEP